MQLRIRSITYLAADINGYELVDPNGRDLPRFSAGSHVGVRLGESVWRDYSLWNDPAERRRYCIAVLRDELDFLAAQGRVVFHYDGGDPKKGLDIAALLRRQSDGTHLYYCGPAGMM